MLMKVKSEQVRTEKYVCECVAGANEFLHIKSRPGEVLVVGGISIYNGSGANTGTCYIIRKVQGIICRIHSITAVNNTICAYFVNPHYLVNGDECGVILTPNAAGDEIEVVYTILRFRDDEYDKPT